MLIIPPTIITVILIIVRNLLKTGKTGKGERLWGIKAFVPHDVRVIKMHLAIPGIFLS